MIRSGLEMNRANRAPSSSKCNSLRHKNIHFGFNWCVASHLCSTQINSKSSKSRKFVCYETFKIPRASISMLGLGSESPSKLSTEHALFICRPDSIISHLNAREGLSGVSQNRRKFKK